MSSNGLGDPVETSVSDAPHPKGRVDVNLSVVDNRTRLAELALDPAVARIRQEMADQSAAFESAPAGLVVAWAVERFGPKLALSCSFQEAVLIDIAVAVDPGIEVVFLDTGSHFDETLEYVESIRARYDLNLTVTSPVDGADGHPCGTSQCCEFRKVRPLRRALAGKDAWVTGLKRSDAATRRHAPIVSYDENWGMVKINPLATWNHQDLVGYAVDHGIPQHPLRSAGYHSIGCAPTTRPVGEGEDLRAGRWADSDKVECGLHL
ncbi:MAG: phosphoadenylyl-sulfate reductase [Acidimicrobiales bacterium]